MGWMLLGLFLVVAYFTLWAVALFCGSDDDLEMERYEAERAAFEQMFE